MQPAYHNIDARFPQTPTVTPNPTPHSMILSSWKENRKQDFTDPILHMEKVRPHSQARQFESYLFKPVVINLNIYGDRQVLIAEPDQAGNGMNQRPSPCFPRGGTSATQANKPHRNTSLGPQLIWLLQEKLELGIFKWNPIFKLATIFKTFKHNLGPPKNIAMRQTQLLGLGVPALISNIVFWGS